MLYDGTSTGNYHNGDTIIDGTLTVGDFTIPDTDGKNGQVLKTDGNGVLTWSADSAGANDITFTGTAPVSVGEVIAFNNTNGLEAKETGILASNIILSNGTVAMSDSLTLSDNGVKFANDATMNITKSGNYLKINSGATDMKIDNATGGVFFEQGGQTAEITSGRVKAPYFDTINTNMYVGTITPSIVYISKAGGSTAIQGTSVHEQSSQFVAPVFMDNVYEYNLNAGTTFHNDLKATTIRQATGAGVSFIGDVYLDNLYEYNLGSGVIVNNVLKTNEIEERTNPSGLTCNSVFKVDTIQEKTLDSGVLIDNVLHKDGGIRVLGGGLSTPSLAYANDATTGYFFTAFPSVNATAQGQAVFTGTSTYFDVQSNEMRVANIVERIPTQGVQIEDLAIVDRSIDAKTAGTMTVGGAVQTALNIGRSGITTSNLGILANTLGSATNPSYTFTGDTDTGIYSQGADAISFTTAGVRKMAIINGATVSYQPLNLQLSNAGSNPITLQANSNDVLAFGTTTNYIMAITNSTNTVAFNGVVSFNSGLRANSITGISGTMNIGTSISNAVSIGASGVPTTINGDFKYQQAQLEAYVDVDNTTTITTLDTWTPTNFTSMTQRAGATGFTMDVATTIGELSVNFSDRTRYCHSGITFSCRLASGTNRQLNFSVWRTDGTPAQVPGTEGGLFIGNNASESQSTAIHFFPSMSSGQKYRLYCKNVGGTEDIIISHMNWFVVASPNVV